MICLRTLSLLSHLSFSSILQTKHHFLDLLLLDYPAACFFYYSALRPRLPGALSTIPFDPSRRPKITSDLPFAYTSPRSNPRQGARTTKWYYTKKQPVFVIALFKYYKFSKLRPQIRFRQSGQFLDFLIFQPKKYFNNQYKLLIISIIYILECIRSDIILQLKGVFHRQRDVVLHHTQLRPILEKLFQIRKKYLTI